MSQTPSPHPDPGAARQRPAAGAPPEPGYVPGISGAGEEDPGASMDLVAGQPGDEPQHDAAQQRPAPSMPTLKIDFVSDISCPWCAVGLASLEQALQRLQAQFDIVLRLQPFELNPAMPPGGQDITEHLTQKYGSTPEQQAGIRDTLRQRGAEVGFAFNPEGRGRIYNTFDAHRLLHWAGLAHPARQLVLKKALLRACHQGRQAMDVHEVLLAAAREAGLDEHAAREVLQSGAHADEVRARERFYTDNGVHAVPAVVVNDRHLISGAQPAAAYEQALCEIASASLRQAA